MKLPAGCCQVCGAESYVEVGISNSWLIPFKIDRISLLAKHVSNPPPPVDPGSKETPEPVASGTEEDPPAWHAASISMTLSAASRPHRILLPITPLYPGQLQLLGCEVSSATWARAR
jgi:hypothetical protein